MPVTELGSKNIKMKKIYFLLGVGIIAIPEYSVNQRIEF